MMKTTEDAIRDVGNLPLSTRETLELELLIDLEESCTAQGLPSVFPFPTALTHELYESVESIPYRMLGQIPRSGGRVLFLRGADALE